MSTIRVTFERAPGSVLLLAKELSVSRDAGRARRRKITLAVANECFGAFVERALRTRYGRSRCYGLILEGDLECDYVV